MISAKSSISSHVYQHQETSKVDVGEIFYKAKTPKEFSYAMKTLTMSQKYHLLTIPKEQLKEKAFPAQYLAGYNRSFRLEWLSQHPWMTYSGHVDGVFCTACAMFCSDASKSKFVTKQIRKWNKKSEKVKDTNTLHIIRRPWCKLTILNELLSTHIQQSQPELIPVRPQKSSETARFLSL